MDIETLEKKIDRKADAEVQAAISTFRDAVQAAMNKLFATRIPYWSDMGQPQYRATLEILAGIRKTSSREGGGWPARLWDVRREAIRKDIMSTMDTLQKVLLAPEPTEPAANTMEGSEPAKPHAAVPTSRSHSRTVDATREFES